MNKREKSLNYTYEEALHKAAAYCSVAEKCVFDVQTKLESWGMVRQDSDKIILQLKNDKFIDEKRFAEYYAKDKFRFNKWGKIKIGIMLQSKNIAKEQIQNALETIDTIEYQNMLVTLLKQKAKNINYKSDYEKRGKLFHFAQNRGFETKAIDTALKTL
ncbi:MAG: regulatory protein RecX [Paludibacteraceae bacterium]|nr:regulatory protein RecX [Paludibacteraceae bacterium]